MAQAAFDTAALALSGVLHHWKSDEQSGTTLADSVGTTHLTVGVDLSTMRTTGPDGVAQVPVNNGTANRAAINNTGFAPPATVTYYWWERYDTSANNDGMIWELFSSGTQFVQADFNYSGSGTEVGSVASRCLFSCDYGAAGAAQAWLTRGTIGQWYFYCMTIDPSLGTSAPVKVYRDAVLVSTDTTGGTGSQNGQTPATMKVGVLGRNNAGTRQLPISAAICSFGLTNTLLSTAQMTSLRNAMVGGATVAAAPIAPTPLRALIGR